MRNHRLNITALTQRELDAVIAAANFSHDQEEIFKELNKDTLYDIGIMQKLGIPERRYYSTKRTTIEKTERILEEFGWYHAMTRYNNKQ
jgi:hypothetical protein